MKASPDVRWDNALALIRENVSQQQYDTWFRPIVFESFDESKKTLLVQVPSPFVYEYLEENYVDLLIKVLHRTFCEGIRLNYRVVTDKEHKLSQDIESDPADIKEQPRSRANQSPTPLDAAQPQQIDPQLNPHLSFANYIEGASNKLPRSVGQSIAEHPNTTQFNPMFIYGPSGCGKTHLVNAIGLRTKQLYPQKRVLYISARLFQVQYTNAVLQNSTNDFIRFYQTIDMLIVDDIQEWISAPKTQDTFFHIVRDLQGVINSLMAYSIVYNSNIDMRLAERVIKRAVKIDDKPLTVDEIIETVCNHFNVSPSAVGGKSRKRDFVVARQVSMYLAQKYTKMPASRIGKLVGNRDHSTVIHSCTQVENRLKVDKEFLAEIESLENSFKIKA